MKQLLQFIGIWILLCGICYGIVCLMTGEIRAWEWVIDEKLLFVFGLFFTSVLSFLIIDEYA